MVPDVELPGIGSVNGRDEVGQAVRHADDVLIGADTVKRRNFFRGQLLFLQGKAPAGVRIADDGILTFGPAKNRDAPARPVFNPLRAGVVLVLESEQAKVSGRARREAGDFDVIPHHVAAGRKAVRLSFEESFLEIPARAPAQHLADVQVFAQDVAHHVLRIDALARFLVVSASGGVDVVVSRVPAHLRGINPALELEPNLLRPGLDLNLLSPFSILGSPRALDGIVARRQQDGLPVRPVNLRVKREIRRESLDLRRVNAPQRIVDHE